MPLRALTRLRDSQRSQICSPHGMPTSDCFPISAAAAGGMPGITGGAMRCLTAVPAGGACRRSHDPHSQGHLRRRGLPGWGAPPRAAGRRSFFSRPCRSLPQTRLQEARRRGCLQGKLHRLWPRLMGSLAPLQQRTQLRLKG